MGGTGSRVAEQSEELKNFHLKARKVYEEELGNKEEVTAKDLLNVFPNRLIFCQAFVQWMKTLSYKGTANRQSFIFATEILLLDSNHVLKPEYKNHAFNFLEIFMHMVLSKLPQNIESISQQQVESFIAVLVNLFLDENEETDLIKKSLFSLVKSLFAGNSSALAGSVIYAFKSSLPYIVFFAKNKFENLLFHQKEIEVPLIKGDHIMNKQILLLLGLTNNKILNRFDMKLIYSSRSMGSSFHRLSSALVGYEAPTIMLIRNNYDLINSHNNTGIFGAYTNCKWEDSLSYFGSPENYLFKITPEFKTFFTFNGQGGKEYVYLNTKHINNSIYKPGLAFGGGIKTKPRIWLDYELLTKSKAEDKDKTYENGILTQSPYDHLKINCIEIWGFPDETTEEKQQSYKKMENDMIMNNRKIDKKAMFAQQGNELLFENQFKFKEQLNIDFEHEKAKVKREE